MPVYLAKLYVSNFRKLAKAELTFQEGLNVLVGANNVGKTAVIDALRALLAGQDEPYARLDAEDVHQPKGGAAGGDITFQYVFHGLSPDDEADFLAALKPGAGGMLEAQFTVRYAEPDKAGRLRAKRWCGDHEDVGLTSDMLENLRGVYLPPLRDASQGLKPSRASQLSRLLRLLSDQAGEDKINAALRDLDEQLRKHEPIVKTQDAISSRHTEMLGDELAQSLSIGLSATDFQRLASRLSLAVDTLEIEQNGLGFNNLIFMAVVLSELARNPDQGLPASSLVADTQWHPLLVPRVKALLNRLQSQFGLLPGDNVGNKLKKTNLLNRPLQLAADLATEPQSILRVDTVHKVKGESLDAVLYLAEKDHVEALLQGVDTELGRIGYVAATRARNLLWLAIPSAALPALRPNLIAKGFVEAGAMVGAAAEAAPNGS